MEGFDPHIVHLHDFSSGANLLHLRAAKTHGAKIVMTYHSPGQSCLQRSLLYQGRTPCDGEILEIRCTECRLTNAGMPSLAAKALAAVPISDRFDAFSLPGVSRALTSRQNTRRFIEAWRELIETLDKAIVYSDWSRDLMLLNGVPASMLRMVRTGMEGQRLPQELPTEPRGLPLRVAYVGRCDLAKGIDILIDAVKKMERTDIEVHFFGPYWEEAYGLSLLRRIDGDPRFNTPKMVAPDQVMQILRGMDVCVVPSRMLETGPIVVLEAFAAGKPVIGSRLGGIAELVTDGVDGLLFPPGDADSLSGLLTRLVQDPGLLEALEAGVMAPRTFTDVALEMGEVYRELLT
jgi:glycosyltransferase involved in cell wall biosynthesis